jgi:hypothetical protein
MASTDPRDFETCERERQIVGLGKALADGMGAMIVGLIIVWAFSGLAVGFFVGWLVFA